MKGIIVEIHNHTAAVLSEDGCVVKIHNNNYRIGQEVSMKKRLNTKKAIAFVSAAASFMLVSGISAYAYFTPYSHVSLDVNPSVEYEVNRFDRVLSVDGVNEDGEDIINEIDADNLENRSIEDAISMTIDEISNAGYFDSEDGGIVITASSDDTAAADELVSTLEDVATTELEENNDVAEVIAEAVGEQRVKEASELGVTPGKLNLVEKLIESAGDSETIDMNEWLNRSVKDIMAQTKEYKKENKVKGQNTEETQIDEQSATELQSEDTNTELESITDVQTETSDSEKSNGKKNNDNKKGSTDSETDSDINETVLSSESETTISVMTTDSNVEKGQASNNGKGSDNSNSAKSDKAKNNK